MLKYSDYDHDYNKNSQFINVKLGGLPILIDEGIILPDDTLITSGKLLEVAREAKRLVDNENWKGFNEYMNDSTFDQFDEDDQSLLRHTVIRKRGSTIFDVLLSIN